MIGAQTLKKFKSALTLFPLFFFHLEVLANLPPSDSGLNERDKTDTYSQTVGNERPTKALDKYSVYISLATPSR